MTQSSEGLPTAKDRRINELDVFRGFAIFGIFMVNILVMNISFGYRFQWESEQVGALQQGTLFTLETLFYSKFFTIFSFLFGLGVALQIQRSVKKGTYSFSFFFRRFGALLLFGAAHILFLWSGDILHLYATLGFLLLLLFKLSPRALLVLSAVVFLFPFYSVLFEQLMSLVGFNYAEALSELSRSELVELKRHGSYLSGMQLRIKEYSFAMGLMYAGIAPMALSMMLLGGYIVKKGHLQNLYGFAQRIKVPFLISFGVLLVYRFVLLYVIVPYSGIEHGSYASMILLTFYQLSDIAIALFFLWCITGLLRTAFFNKVLSPLRHVGRMALTNYILQSVVGFLVMRTFKGYETFSPFSCAMLVVVVFAGQVVLSKLWLKSFIYGPLEWCWRCISYRKILPLRKER